MPLGRSDDGIASANTRSAFSVRSLFPPTFQCVTDQMRTMRTTPVRHRRIAALSEPMNNSLRVRYEGSHPRGEL